MKAKFFNVLLFAELLFSAKICYSQDAIHPVNAPFSNSRGHEKTITSGNRYLINFHSSTKEDHQLYDSFAYLINSRPSIGNHEQYFKLGLALWNLHKMEEAEKMFLTIADSGKAGTDIFDDNIKNNSQEKQFYYPFYKNLACRYLAKIYVENEKFTKALVYLDKAMNRYKITYKCGSQQFQNEEYLALNSHCYKMLHLTKEYIDCVLPEFITWRDDFLIEAIKAIYTPQEIADYLTRAKKSINCTINSLPSTVYSAADDGKGGRKWDTIIYYSSAATIDVFDRKITLNHIFNSLENRETVKSYYLNLYEESEFYRKLYNEERIVKRD